MIAGRMFLAGFIGGAAAAAAYTVIAVALYRVYRQAHPR